MIHAMFCCKAGAPKIPIIYCVNIYAN